MINKKRLLENLIRINPPKPLFEYNASELSTMSDSARKMRSSSMSAFYSGISQGQDGQAKTHWKVPSQSNKEVKYQPIVEIVVPVSGGLFGLAKGKWDPKKYSETLKKSDVKVYCDCPDFHWSGMAYNLGPNGKYKNSNVNASNSITAPNIRDPERKNVLCKHLLTIIKVFPFNASDIFASARKFDAQIKTDPEITKNLDDGVKPLTKDIETVSVTQEQKDVIMDSIQTAASNQLSKDVSPDGANEIIQDVNDEAKSEESTDNINVGAEDLIDNNVNEIAPVENSQKIIDEQNQKNISKETPPVAVEEPYVEEIIEPEIEEVPEEPVQLEKDKADGESLAVKNPSDVLGRI